MQSILTDNDLRKAIVAAGTGGAKRPRVVKAEVLFDEDGNILTYFISSEQLHTKRGGDINSLLGRVINQMAPPPKTRRKKTTLTD